MWFRKKEEKKKQVKCETCKHYVDKEDAQEIEVFNHVCGKEKEYYCPLHIVKYDFVEYTYRSPNYVWGGGFTKEKREYYIEVPAKKVRVTEKGKVIKK